MQQKLCSSVFSVIVAEVVYFQDDYSSFDLSPLTSVRGVLLKTFLLTYQMLQCEASQCNSECTYLILALTLSQHKGPVHYYCYYYYHY